jgi:Ankyrin repeats (many copies)/Protein of unknown function (DUF1573)
MKLFGTYVVLLACFVPSYRATAQEPQKKENADAKVNRFPDGQSHDFGKVAYGAYVKHTFRLLNTADVPLEIISVRSSAGGLRVQVSKAELKPKEEAKLLVLVETRRFIGSKTMAFYLTMRKKDGPPEEIRFFITCNSDKDLKLDPTILLQNRLMEAACKGVSVARDGLPPSPGVYLGDEKSPNIATVLREGATVDGPDQRGCTALMYASICGLAENVKTLLANGADATLKDEEGWTALMYAEADHNWRVEGRREVAKILKEHLAKKR